MTVGTWFLGAVCGFAFPPHVHKKKRCWHFLQGTAVDFYSCPCNCIPHTVVVPSQPCSLLSLHSSFVPCPHRRMDLRSLDRIRDFCFHTPLCSNHPLASPAPAIDCRLSARSTLN